MVLIAGILILAAGAGAGAGLLMTALDKSYTQASELQEAFGLPVLGALSETMSARIAGFTPARLETNVRRICNAGADRRFLHIPDGLSIACRGPGGRRAFEC